MIGQVAIQNKINMQIDSGDFPHFCILVGAKGSGKKLLAKEISRHFSNVEPYIVPISVEEIRKMINAAYKITKPYVYIIADADNMSNAAKNAILKVTEEPPNNAYFIMTLQDTNNTLPTILSRGTVFEMDRYTPDELWHYFDAECYLRNESSPEVEIVKDICETPGEVDTLVKMGISDFYNFVELVIDNLATAPLANAFKLAEKLSLKKDAEGYDLALFFKAIMRVCTQKAQQEKDSVQKYSYLKYVQITSKYLQDLRITSINKSILVDAWIAAMRRVN